MASAHCHIHYGPPTLFSLVQVYASELVDSISVFFSFLFSAAKADAAAQLQRDKKGRVGEMVRRVRINSKYSSPIELCISLWAHTHAHTHIHTGNQRHCQFQIDKMIPGCGVVRRPEITSHKPSVRRPVCRKEPQTEWRKDSQQIPTIVRFRKNSQREGGDILFSLSSKIHRMVAVTVL